jgi:hypothetical protein
MDQIWASEAIFKRAVERGNFAAVDRRASTAGAAIAAAISTIEAPAGVLD